MGLINFLNLDDENKLKKTVLYAESFGYNIAKSSVYSSMIEGNPIDFDSYLRYTNAGFNTKSKSFKEIQDLINAFDFASKNPLNKKNILTAHKILCKNLLEEEKYIHLQMVMGDWRGSWKNGLYHNI